MPENSNQSLIRPSLTELDLLMSKSVKTMMLLSTELARRSGQISETTGVPILSNHYLLNLLEQELKDIDKLMQIIKKPHSQ